MHNYSEAARDSAMTEIPSGLDPCIQAPPRLALHPARPNPASTSTSITFDLPTPATTRLQIYDPAGRLVRVLIDQPLAAGNHRYDWDGKDDAGRRVANGVYLYRLDHSGRKLSHQLLWIR
jgi:hypothetical protein